MKIIVVGDIMLDTYLKGDVERVSPEAPIPIVLIREKDFRAGGAANVAVNCKALGAEVVLAGTIGKDENGSCLLELLKDAGIDISLVQQTTERETTTKTRILSRNQQMIRFDAENESLLPLRLEHDFIDNVLKFLQIEKPDALIFEDYNKGLLTENVIQQIIRHCKILNIPVAVDPKKQNIFAYREVTVFKPNLKEIREGLNISLQLLTLKELQEAHLQLKEKLAHKISLITLSENGVFYDDSEHSAVLPSHKRNIADVSGAGDTVIAVATMVYACTKDIIQMALWANLAGGLVCEKAGVVPIDKQQLIKEIENKL